MYLKSLFALLTQPLEKPEVITVICSDEGGYKTFHFQVPQ